MQNIYSIFFSTGKGDAQYSSYYTPQRTNKSLALSMVKENTPV